MTMSRLMSILRRRNRNAEVVTLTDSNSAGDGPLTAINRPDTLSPLTHRLPVRVPDPETLQKELLLRVDELAAAGALDEGCAGAFDRLLEEIGAQWNVALEADAVGRQRVAARLYALDLANHRHQEQHLANLQEDLLRARASHEYWRDQLLGHRAVLAPATAVPAARFPGQGDIGRAETADAPGPSPSALSKQLSIHRVGRRSDLTSPAASEVN